LLDHILVGTVVLATSALSFRDASGQQIPATTSSLNLTHIPSSPPPLQTWNVPSMATSIQISFTSSLSPSNTHQIALVSVDQQTLASYASSFGINPLPTVYLPYMGFTSTTMFADRLVMFPETSAFNNSAPSYFLDNCAPSGDLLSLTCDLPPSAAHIWWLLYVITFSFLDIDPGLNGMQLQYLLQAPLMASSGAPWTLTFGQLPSLDTTSVRTFKPNAAGLRIMPFGWIPSDTTALDDPIQPIDGGIRYIPALSTLNHEELYFAGTTLSAPVNILLGYIFNLLFRFAYFGIFLPCATI
jgi:hypothetical protein